MVPNSERVQALVEKLKHPDADVKVDAMGKLQLEFEEAEEVPDPDPLIHALRPLLRSPNPQLSTSTLFLLPSILRLIPTEHALRLALSAFLAPGGGGLLERFGDGRERTREAAREGVRELGGRCLVLGEGKGMKGKGSVKDGDKESVGAMFERFLKEGGFGSKVPRVREQCLLLLKSLRTAHPTFPLRPYLTPLIDALQDSDGTVRTLSQATIITLFGPGSGVSDAARAELKKVAGQKNVRKGIWEGVWERVCGAVPATAPEGEGEGDEGDAEGRRGLGRSVSHGVLPSQVASGSRPASRIGAAVIAGVDPLAQGEAEVVPVYIASPKDLESEFAAMLPHFQGKETEHNWLQRENAVFRVRGMLKADVWKRMPDALFAVLKGGFLDGTLRALSSLRTTLSGTTCALYATLSITMQHAFDPFLDLLLPPLLRMSSLTKRLTAQLSQSTLATLLSNASPLPRIVLPPLLEAVTDKNTQTRQAGVTHLRVWVQTHGHTRAIEHLQGGVDALFQALKKALTDAAPGVRDDARRLYWAVEPLWPDRAQRVADTLDAPMKRQLLSSAPPTASALPKTAPSTPAAKRSAMAATIAAHRARVKAGAGARSATSPPSMPPSQAAMSDGRISPSKLPLAPNSGGRASPTKLPGAPSSGGRASPAKLIPRLGPGASVSASPAKPSGIPAPQRPPAHARSPSSPTSATPSRIPSAHLRTASGGTLRTPSSSSVRSAVAAATAPTPMALHLPASAVKKTSQLSKSSVPPVAAVDDEDDYQLPNLDADETLLLATKMPLPPDSDSDDSSFDPFNFSPAALPRVLPVSRLPTSPPRQATPPRQANTRSDVSSPTSHSFFSPPHNPDPAVPQSVIEDALRAQAEQAESTADRLLELVEPDDEPHSQIIKPPAMLGKENALPRTPANKRTSAILRQAALFKDTPGPGASPSPLDILGERRHETGWWIKRVKLANQTASGPADLTEQPEKLSQAISALSDGTATARTLQDLALICIANPCRESGLVVPPSPTPNAINAAVTDTPDVPQIWRGGALFDALFDQLIGFLTAGKPADVLEYGLILLWEMLEHQEPLLEEKEMKLFTLLIEIRYSNVPQVLEATTTIRDALTARFNPVFGVTTMGACLRAFLHQQAPPETSPAVRSGTHAFGLICIGKYILRLPGDILEDELPRLKGLLAAGLTDPSSDVREAANIAVVAAQLVLQDESHLFTLLDGIEDSKKNLLTYYFERYKTRSIGRTKGRGPSQELIEKEMRRLDLKATPPRPMR